MFMCSRNFCSISKCFLFASLLADYKGNCGKVARKKSVSSDSSNSDSECNAACTPSKHCYSLTRRLTIKTQLDFNSNYETCFDLQNHQVELQGGILEEGLHRLALRPPKVMIPTVQVILNEHLHLSESLNLLYINL